MRKIILIMIVALLLTQVGQAQIVDEQSDALILGNIDFAFDMYQNLQAQEAANLMISPYSISQALAMTYAGARGTTATEMADVLHFTLPQTDLHPTFDALTDRVTAVPVNALPDHEERGFELRIANALWGLRGLPFYADYLELVNTYYEGGFQEVDFRQPEQAAEQINTWVEEQTEDRIQDLIDPDLISGETSLILTNAIYFNADWAIPFTAEGTREDTFTLLDGGVVTVPLMNQTSYFLYMEAPEYQAVSMPYYGDKIHMLVILPQAGVFEDIEATLSSELYGLIWRSLENRFVQLTLPSFTYEYEIRLGDTLKAMGMGEAFDRASADFSAILDLSQLQPPGQRTYIQEVVHKTFVRVDEEGTEAAAATGVIMGTTGGGLPPEPVIFRADRPFIYLIYDRDTGSILFLGRVVNPA